MNQILDRLYLGCIENAYQAASPITVILNLCEHGYESPLLVIHAPMPDEVFLPAWEWQSRLHALGMLLQNRHSVLVHCRLGVSRSPALVTAYLASVGWCLEQARLVVRARRSCVNIHPETWRGVEEWWTHQGHRA